MMLLKHELLLTLILFILLFLKLGKGTWSNAALLTVVNILLLINFAAGFFMNEFGEMFNGMFRTNATIVFEKNILNLGALIISMQSSAWLKNHKHLPEFFMLMLSTLIGMFFM